MPSKPPTFRPPGAPSSVDIQRAYDKRRGSAHSRGYTAKLRSRMDAFKRDHPLCLGCSAVGRVTATAVTDHVVPAKGDLHLLWDDANWQPACREHHDIVKQRIEDRFVRGQALASDLRLDSAMAIKFTRDLMW